MKHDTLFDLIRGLLCLNVAGIYASFNKGSKNIILAFDSDPIESKKKVQNLYAVYPNPENPWYNIEI